MAVQIDLKGIRVGLLGGDRRELVVADLLAARGAQVRAVGLPWPDPVSYTANRLEDVASWANVVIAPVGGTDEVGYIAYSIVPYAEFPGPRLTEDIVSCMRPGTLLVIGSARPELTALCRRYDVRLVAYRDWDSFAILNAIPSAEGAVAMAMEESDITLHGSVTMVLGFGRLGTILANMLKGIGALTVVVARDVVDLTKARALGHRSVDFGLLHAALPDADIVFNTVPALVLPEAQLERMRRDAVVIDVATAPGGTDFAAARRLGLKARLAPGLPGLVAPRTAGQIEAETVLRILRDELGLRAAG